MGFYGRIANSNKTAFSFDKVYSSRIAMDNGAENDGVFIGRYVLIEYDEPPITGYFSGTEFYSSIAFQNANRITPREGIIYQDLLRDKAPYTFYYWDGTKYAPASNGTSAYAVSYNRDVLQYGRGYDSTAWMKTYDTAKNKYRYVLIAELNTVVPNFHLITDAPCNTPAGVYFDRDTTGVDYYMHQQAEWGQGMRLFTKVRDFDNNIVTDALNGISGAKSDEEIKYVTVAWGTDVNGHQYYNRVTNNVGPADIYYNKDGFDKETHTKANTSIKNTINYTYDKSGRLYGGGLNDSEMSWNVGQTELDMMEWYIHLPILGDAVCEVWDTLYGYDSENKRYTALSTQRSDPGSKVTYNVNTALGAINKIKDLMGWCLREKGSGQAVNSVTTDRTKTNYVYYTTKASANKEEPVIDKYFIYAYDPLYVEATTHVSTDPNTGENTYTFTYTSGGSTITGGINDIFFLDPVDNLYKRPNVENWPAVMSDGSIIGAQYNNVYLAQDRWKFVQLQEESEDTIYGLILKLHRILGDYSPNIRDPNSFIGCINLLNDIIANISTKLKPYKIMVTDQNGTLTTSNIEFPYFNTMSRTISGTAVKNQELLDSAGNWRLPVSYRLYTLNLKNSSQPTKYFDGAYYGNSCLHAVLETDMLGDAIKKMQNEMADIQYKPQTASLTATTTTQGESNTSYRMVENGKNITDVTLSYTLNKGPRQSISLVRNTPTRSSAVYSQNNINPEYYVTNPTQYAASAQQTHHDTQTITASGLVDQQVKYTLTVQDERDYVATATATIQYCNKAYWGVGTKYEASQLSTFAAVNSAFGSFANGGGHKLATSKFSPTRMTATGANTYIYWMQPSSWSTPIFKIGGFEGGMDDLGTVQFTNASGYTREYRVWRSTNTNLGATDVVIS